MRQISMLAATQFKRGIPFSKANTAVTVEGWHVVHDTSWMGYANHT
jgi:hypothetical protein